MFMMKTIWQCQWSLWTEIITKVKHAMVYMDDSCAEMLHWQGGLPRLLEAGAVDVREFSSFETAGSDHKKAVFIISKLLRNSVAKNVLKDIIEQSNFQFVTVITSVSSNVHVFDRTGSAESDDKKDFDDLEDLLLQWMRNMNYTAEVFHYPLLTTSICPGVFVTPAFASFFPLLDSDIMQIQQLYNTAQSVKGDRTSFTTLSEILAHHLPKSLQLTLKMFACCFHGLMSDLGVREDLYSIGHTSRLLATEIENYAPARVRRKNVPNRASVVLIDRTLDLVTLSGHQFDVLIDKITSVLPSLPRHNIDVTVDMSAICAVQPECGQVIVPGSLASGSYHTQPDHLHDLVLNKHKECLMNVNRRLVEAATKEELPVNLSGRTGRVTSEQLYSTLSLFKGKYKAIQPHIDILQVAMATAQALECSKKGYHDNLLSMEKKLVQFLGDESQESGLEHIMTLLGDQLVTSKEERSHTLDDILLILVYLYSLSDGEFTDEEEEHLEDLLVKAIVAENGDLPPIVKSIVGDAVASSMIRNLLEDFWEKLRSISTARDDLKQFQHLLAPGTAVSPPSVKPLLKTLVEEIFNPEKPDLVDLEFKSSGFKDLLKSGFGFFKSVSKPRPSDHPLLIVFVVGGITGSEIRQIHEVVERIKPDTQVLIGSTALLRRDDILRSIFCQNNVNLEDVL